MASFTWEGDYAEAVLWYPFAVSNIQQMGKHGLHTRVISPDSGVEIFLQVNPFHIHIRASISMYMESGFYRFDQVLSFKPLFDGMGAKCYYNNLVASSMAFEFPDQAKAFLSRNSDNPDAALKGQSLSSGFESKSHLYTEDGKHDDEEVFRLNYATYFKVPPSVYAGKLKLMVSAIYGAKNNTLNFIDGSFTPKLRFGDQILDPLAAGTVNSGLYTSSKGDYFIIQAGAQISFHKLELSGKGKILQSMILNGAFGSTSSPTNVFRTQAEAYVLSTAFVDTEQDIDKYKVDIVDNQEINGFFLYWGWQWKWDGSGADAIIHEYDSDKGVNISNHVRLSIKDVIDSKGDYTFIVTRTLISRNEWWRSILWFSILIPFPFLLKLKNAMYDELYSPPPHNVRDPSGVFSDIPIYCFRDENDALQFVEISQDLSFRNDIEENKLSWAVYPDETFLEEIFYDGFQGDISVKCNGKKIKGTYEQIRRYNKVTYTSNGETSSFPDNWQTDPPIPPLINRPVPGSGNVGDVFVATGQYTHSGSLLKTVPTGEQVDRGDGVLTTTLVASRGHSAWQDAVRVNEFQGWDDNSKITVVIPYFSCNSVFVVSQQKIGERTREIKTATKTINWFNIQAQVAHVYFDQNQIQQVSSIIDANIQLSWGLGLFNSSSAVVVNENVPVEFKGKMWIFTGSVTDLIEEKDIENYDYFQFSFLDFFVETNDNIFNSVKNGYKYYSGYSGPKDVNYPGTVSVGWA